MSGVSLRNNKNFIESLRLFEEDRKIDPEFVLDTLKEAIAKAYQKHIDAPEAKVRVDLDKSELHVYHVFDVVANDFEDFDDSLDVYLDEARETNPDAKVGDTIEVEIDFSEIGRTSINVAKQMLKQRIKENEKQKVYDEYKDREYDLVSGIIKTVEEKFVLIDIKNTIGIMLKSEQIPGETYREGQSIRTIIKKVEKNSKGSQVQLSRADAIFVKRLFEKEVPEIAQGIVEIKAIARDAGERTKMAVFSRNDEVDPIGACIGPRGSRIQSVIVEVKGEKIDVFEWNDDIGELVKNALAPAEVLACFYTSPLINPELTEEELERSRARGNMPLVVVVDDDKLSIAIGKKGKNAKLAVKLTNRKIDIKTISEIRELGIDIEKEVEFFKADQVRIIKEREMKKFQELQEEAMRRKAQFDEEMAKADTGMIEEVFEELETKPEEVTILDIKEEKPEEVREEKAEVKEVSVQSKEEKEEEKAPKTPKKPLVPKTDYVSKFEDIADASKTEEKTVIKKKRRKSDDDDRRVRAEDLEKKEYGEIKPEYSEEELEEIEFQQQQEEENSWINDDDIDFDEYDDLYDDGK